MIRSFVAVDLPEAARDVLREIGEQLGSQVPGGSVRWTRVSNVHLTLKFLGDVAETDLPEIKAVLAQVGQRHAPFTFTVGGAGCFPNLKRPRVVWVGIREGTGALAALQRDVEKSLVPLGFKPEKRAFHPHLTLGRTRRGVRSSDLGRVGEVVAAANVGELGQVRVKSFRLMRSDLHPDGAIYTSLAVCALGLKSKEG